MNENNGENLDALFQPLDDRTYRIKNFDKEKAKGIHRITWLRIYAVKFNDGHVVTGAAIKLTHKMEERDNTILELKKLDIVKTSLLLNTVSDKFVDLE